MINRVAFFNRLKTYNLYQKINKSQVQGIEATLNEWESNPKKYNNIKYLAYILATFYHETAKTLQPIEEYGKGAGRSYGSKLKYGGGPGKRVPYTTPDKIYYGRGHTQNTWYENYEALTKANTKGWDFLNKPELLLQMEPSIWASFYAMFSGLYTGRKFSNFDSSKPVFYLKCRGIINGSDRADLIAVYAEKFEKCLV